MLSVDVDQSLLDELVRSAQDRAAQWSELLPVEDVLVAAGVSPRLAGLIWFNVDGVPTLSAAQAASKLRELAASPAWALRSPDHVLYLLRHDAAVAAEALRSPWLRLSVGLAVYGLLLEYMREVETTFRAYNFGSFDEEAAAYVDADPGTGLPLVLICAWILGQHAEYVNAHMAAKQASPPDWDSHHYGHAVDDLEDVWGWNVRYWGFIDVLGPDMNWSAQYVDTSEFKEACRRIACRVRSQKLPKGVSLRQIKDLDAVKSPVDSGDGRTWTLARIEWLYALARAYDQKLIDAPKSRSDILDPLYDTDPGCAEVLALSAGWAQAQR